MLDDDFTLTKRQLGLLMIAGGVALFVVTFAADLVRDQTGGFGTLQILGMLFGTASVLIGVTLLPLGDHPA